MSDARLFLSPGIVLYLGPGIEAGRHRHHAIQLSWGLEAPLRLSYEGREIEARAVVVPSGVVHEFTSRGQTVIALIEPEGGRGAALQRQASELGGEDVLDRLSGVGPPPSEAGVADAIAWVESAIARLAADGVTSRDAVGPIVSDALEWLEGAAGGSVRLEEAAAAAAVSPSRLTHLFTSEVGIPFRRYVLWLRLRLAVEAVKAGDNLTQAAISAGFSDSAHLTRTFKETFGLPPSRALGQLEIAGRLWREAREPGAG